MPEIKSEAAVLAAAEAHIDALDAFFALATAQVTTIAEVMAAEANHKRLWLAAHDAEATLRAAIARWRAERGWER